jgi:hypothetical protein|tara:strand:+ start:644 stop:1171 length:528 start_codon:yes stop_codon:yes gene_type:complete
MRCSSSVSFAALRSRRSLVDDVEEDAAQLTLAVIEDSLTPMVADRSLERGVRERKSGGGSDEGSASGSHTFRYTITHLLTPSMLALMNSHGTAAILTVAVETIAFGLHLGGRTTPEFLKKSKIHVSADGEPKPFIISAMAGTQQPYFAPCGGERWGKGGRRRVGERLMRLQHGLA